MVAFDEKEVSASKGTHLESDFESFDKFLRLTRGTRNKPTEITRYIFSVCT